MLTVERRATAPVDTLWEFVSDVAHWDRMLPTTKRVERLDADGPAGVGSRLRLHQLGLMAAVYEVTSWDPGREFTWVARMPGVTTTASHEFDRTRAAGGGGSEDARLRLTLEWSGPLAGVVRLLVGGKTKAMIETEANTFVRLAEADSEG